MTVTETLRTMFFTGGGLKIMLGLLVFFIIIGIMVFLGWRFFKKKYVYKYSFLVVNALGNISTKKGRITLNKQKVEVFELEGLTGKYLQIKEPNLFFDGKPHRVVAYDGMGNIAWCDKLEIDKNNYLKTALTPTERQMQTQAAIEAGDRYGKMPGFTKAAIGFSVVVVIIMVVGMYANGKLALESTVLAADTTTNLIKISENQAKTMNIIERNTRVQEIVLRHLIGDKGYNITLTAD